MGNRTFEQNENDIECPIYMLWSLHHSMQRALFMILHWKNSEN